MFFQRRPHYYCQHSLWPEINQQRIKHNKKKLIPYDEKIVPLPATNSRTLYPFYIVNHWDEVNVWYSREQNNNCKLYDHKVLLFERFLDPLVFFNLWNCITDEALKRFSFGQSFPLVESFIIYLRTSTCARFNFIVFVRVHQKS